MKQEDDPIRPWDWLKVIPFQAVAASDRLGWVGLEAARYRASPAWEYNAPALTHHRLVLVTRPPRELELRFEGVKRHVPPPAGAIILVPAGTPGQVRWSGGFDWLHIYLEPELVARVAAEACDLDPARLTVPPLDAVDLPHLRAAMSAVDCELTTGGAGGPLAAESLANVLAVQLIRHLVAPRRLARGRDGMLPRGRLCAVVEYIEEHLDAGPTLGQMAAVARLSVYHFARQFKAATGLPPHQYVIARRVEQAKELLQMKTELSLAEVAAQVGFTDQSQFSHHFKRRVGVTPGQFQTRVRIDKTA
jgi:AraC family transcriptional regulator